MNVAPAYAVRPEFVTTTVNRTVAPGVVVALLAVLVMLSPDTVTVAVQRGSVLPLAQLVPRVAELTVFASTWLPVTGLATVTE